MLYKRTVMINHVATTLHVNEQDWGTPSAPTNSCWIHYKGIIPKVLNGKFTSNYYILTHVTASVLSKLNITVRYRNNTYDTIVTEEEFVILKLAGVF